MKVFLFKWKIKQIDWKRILCSPWLGQTMLFTWWQPPRLKAEGVGWMSGSKSLALYKQTCRGRARVTACDPSLREAPGAGQGEPNPPRGELRESVSPYHETDKRPLSLGSLCAWHPASGHSSGNLTSPVSKCILRPKLGLWNSS